MTDDCIVWLGDDWGYQMSSAQQLARVLAARHRTLWVNSVGMRRPTLTRRDIGRALAKLARARGFTRMPPGQPMVANIPLIPYHNRPLVQMINRVMAKVWVNRWRKAAGMTSPLVICAVPSAIPIVHAMKPRLVTYYCMDDFATLPGVDWCLVEQCERDLLATADRIVVSSETIAALPRFSRRDVKVLPHGVDYYHFARAQEPPPAEIAALVSCLPRPVVGFAGYLDDRIDVELLKAVADDGRWGLLIIGEWAKDNGELSRSGHTLLVGYQPYDLVPQYLAACDVLIAPYRRSRSTEALQPLKIPEYLATGKPVVASRIPALEEFSDVIRLAEDRAAFLQAVAEACERPQEGREQRLEKARVRSWESRAAQFAGVVGLDRGVSSGAVKSLVTSA